MTVELEELTQSELPAPDRHCGRCQCAFPGDPTLFFQTDWALCPACTAILLPRPAASTRKWPPDENPSVVTVATLRS